MHCFDMKWFSQEDEKEETEWTLELENWNGFSSHFADETETSFVYLNSKAKELDK